MRLLSLGNDMLVGLMTKLRVALTSSVCMQVERLRDRSGKLMNKRDSQKVAAIERDMSRWDEIQLLRSGVAVKLGEDDEEDDKERVMLVVSDAKPPFLDGRQIFTKQMDPVLPLKDPTSDMAVVARRGSKLVMSVGYYSGCRLLLCVHNE